MRGDWRSLEVEEGVSGIAFEGMDLVDRQIPCPWVPVAAVAVVVHMTRCGCVDGQGHNKSRLVDARTAADSRMFPARMAAGNHTALADHKVGAVALAHKILARVGVHLEPGKKSL